MLDLLGKAMTWKFSFKSKARPYRRRTFSISKIPTSGSPSLVRLRLAHGCLVLDIRVNRCKCHRVNIMNHRRINIGMHCPTSKHCYPVVINIPIPIHSHRTATQIIITTPAATTMVCRWTPSIGEKHTTDTNCSSIVRILSRCNIDVLSRHSDSVCLSVHTTSPFYQLHRLSFDIEQRRGDG